MSTYYVDYTGGNDGNDGLSEENAWKTWSHVSSELNGNQSDDIVKAKCGETWSEQYTVAGYGTDGHRFVHTSYGSGNKPCIDGEETRNYCIRAVSKNYLEFDGLELKDAINTGTGGGKDGACIKLESSTGSLLDDLDIYHAKTRGVWFDFCSGCTAQYSLIDTGITDNQYEADSLYLSNGSGNIVRHNEIYEAAQGYYVDGVQTYDDDGITIEYNYMECSQQSDQGSMLLQIEQGSGTVNIRYNILYNTVNQRSIFVLDSSSAAFNVYNNVIINAAGGGSWVGIGLDILSGCSIPTCRNNIFYCTNGLCIISSPSISPTSRLDYNCYYRESGGSELIYDGSDERTWAQMQGLGYEPHGYNADPKFENLSGKDFHIKSDSPCRNVGVDVGLTQDYDSKSVPQETYPCIGAFEYISGGWASFQLDPNAAAYSDDEMVGKVNSASVQVTRASAVSADAVADGTTNKAFTSSEQTKLANIEDSATADMTGDEILSAINAGTLSLTRADVLDQDSLNIVKTNPQSGEYKITAVHRTSSGLLEIEYEDVPV